jgi:formate C-acetyltransferase
MNGLLSFKPTNNDCDFRASLKNRIRCSIAWRPLPGTCRNHYRFLQTLRRKSIVIRRALALADILEKMTIYIEPDMLIVG